MKVIHNLAQGSDAWHQFRLTHFGASEAAAMLGLSKTVRRTDLLRAKKTGIAREFTAWVQEHILDNGHRVEALARPHVEDLIGDSLYPVTISDGLLSAACDGITVDDAIAWEHKSWNEGSADQVAIGDVPLEHMPQCQQVLMITGAEKLLFTVSDGTPERMVHVEVLPDPAWFGRLRAGWEQFGADLDAYVPEAITEAPAGKAPETLPALHIEVTGMVTASNLAGFKETALAAIRSVNRDLSTDSDFADAEKAVRWCSDVESRLAAAKEHALSQTASIDTLFKTIDDISAEARRVRLDLDKLVKGRKESIRTEIVMSAQAALDAHVQGLNARLGANWLPRLAGGFAEAIKGKKTVASLKDAASVELANAKIEASALADRLQANRASLIVDGVDSFFLFADFAQVGNLAPEAFHAVAAMRILKHEAEQAAVEARRKAAEAATQAAMAAAAAPAAIAQPLPLPALAAVPIPAGPVVLLSAGAIAQRLGFPLQVEFIEAKLGVPRHSSEKRATFWTDRQFSEDICPAVVRHVMEAARDVREMQVA